MIGNMRLAFRVEGDRWNAYAADMGNMDKALFLGSIPMVAVVESEQRKRVFMQLMQETLEVLIERAGTAKIEGWAAPRTAPPHERNGYVG